MCVVVSEPEKLVLPTSKTFPTLYDGYVFATNVVRTGIGVQISRLRQDFFQRVLPKDMCFKLLGVQKAAEKFCRRMEPNGQWRIEIENPGTAYEHAGILDPIVKHTKLMRFSAWYTRFLPYAVAMVMAEHTVSNAIGVDYQSINSYYGTCMGFVDMGLGYEPGRFEEADVTLFRGCYDAYQEIKRPQLPFDEAHWPCLVYVGICKPSIITGMGMERGHWWYDLINQSCEKMNKPRPKFRYPRA